jgi:hypothetical protein
MTVVAMSHSELSRYDTLLRVTRRELRVEDAATLMGLSRRQIGRLLIRLIVDGPEGLVSRKRGKPRNRRNSDDLRNRAIALVREHYADFGPTLAMEYLAPPELGHNARVAPSVRQEGHSLPGRPDGLNSEPVCRWPWFQDIPQSQHGPIPGQGRSVCSRRTAGRHPSTCRH